MFESLDNDLNVYLQYSYNRTKSDGLTNAYAPALQYCFSVIEFLPSLYAGEAWRRNTSRNFRSYMRKFMKEYSEENVKLLQNMFRHKLAHISMPKAATKLENGKIISWKLHDPDPENHLTIDYSEEDKDRKIPIGNIGTICYDGKFIVNIMKLKNDIKDSYVRENGYREMLAKCDHLQRNFVKEIYEPADN
jgi:hypothetical protein